MVQPKNYFVLDPKEATVKDLLYLLFSSDLENRKFVDTSVTEFENDLCEFRARWIIFVSIVAQKLMIMLRKPLSFLGYALGFWLNLPSSNGGFFKILINLVQGYIFFWLSCFELIGIRFRKLGITLKIKYKVEIHYSLFISIAGCGNK